MTSNADFKMCEYCSNQILENNITDDILMNFITSLVFLYKTGRNLGPNTLALKQKLDALYVYDHVDSTLGFDIGAIYGSLTFADIFKKELHNEH